MKCKVTFLPENKSVEVSKGTDLLQAAREIGIEILSYCGGQGTCGSCKVKILKGSPRASVSPHLSKEEITERWIQACLVLVEEDLDVFVPKEHRISKPAKISTGLQTASRIEIGKWEITPSIKRIKLKLPAPSLDNNISDMTRLFQGLNQEGYPPEKLWCGLDILKRLAKTLRKKNWEVTVLILESERGFEIVDIQPSDTTCHHYGLAIDIGTTSVVVYLVNLLTGHIIGTESDYNKQISCGTDIISRIIYTERKNGLAILQKLVVETINNLGNKLLTQHKIHRRYIDCVSCAGNTTMTHLFLKIDPNNIRIEPYIPAFTTPPLLSAKEVGMKTNAHTSLYCVPGVSSYIGGDVIGGILASGITKENKLSLFLDVGTNGEIVLGNSEWLVSASCSAGPAFEGAGIKYGMRATNGAIDQVKIDQKTLEPVITITGHEKSIGICGSGIIDTIAEMYLTGIINQKGKFNRDIKTQRVREGKYGWEYVLVWKNDSGIDSDITITEPDIDNILRAKGAIYAGCSLLLKEMGYKPKNLDRFLIAGGFGHYLNIEKAIIIGMLPDIDTEKYQYLGNTSVIGSYLTLLSRNMQEEAIQIAKNVTYRELSVSTEFMNEYMASLFLPHTNVELFPTVQEILRKIKVS
ncbi:MAG: ASKHA domain-containing protein [bacterium]